MESKDGIAKFQEMSKDWEINRKIKDAKGK